MRAADVLTLAGQAIRRNTLRSFLTTLGIVIGVASVVTMVQLGQSATQSVTERIASIGSNLLFVIPGTAQRGPGNVRATAEPFDLADAQALARDIADVRVAPALNTTVTVVAGNVNDSVPVVGTTNGYFPVRNHPLAYGREFQPGELASGAAVCVIGQTLVEDLFSGREPLGATLRVRPSACQVIGVLSEKGESMGQDRDKIVLMPIKAVQRRLVGQLDVDAIYVSALVDGTTGQVQGQIESLLRQRRHISAGAPDDFYVRDTQDIADALEGTTRTLTLLLGAIATVSLLVGGIGIVNIMLVSVTERTREIGIRLAIGARARDVLMQFLVEAVVLSTLGGLVGLLVGLLATVGATWKLDMPLVLSPAIMALGFGFSVAIGIVFGFVPARKAARLNPIDALRHE
ncbi:ABC transporter permease [Marinobacter sp. C2H3]|uniref:ABC transporter permease n=1 Tax=Marinobacter sp. C2H3 TaxID=3119003 RepID=UPI00300F099B